MSKKNLDNAETIIGPGTLVTGDLEVSGTLRIDGQLRGNTTAQWVVIGEKGQVEGNISAKGVVIGGVLNGTVSASERIEVNAKGRVNGDLAAPKLVVEEGGVLDGRSSMHGEGTASQASAVPPEKESPAAE